MGRGAIFHYDTVMEASVQRPLLIAVSTAFFPLIGGAEIATEELLMNLSEYDRVVITARFSRRVPKQETKNGIVIRRIGLGWWGDRLWLVIATPFHVFRLARRRSVVKVFSVMISYGTLGALLASRLLKSAWFGIWLQEGVSEQYLKRGRLGLIALHWKLALSRSHVAAIGQSLANRATACGAKTVTIIPNGINFSLFTANPSRHINDATVLITASRLEEKNGIEDMIDALAQLPDATCIIAGDGSLRHKLHVRAKKLGVANRIEWLGAVPHFQLSQVFARGTVFVRPSRSEGLGNAFIEAMAAQLPVLAPMVGGITDFFKPNENGLEIIPHQPQTIVDAVNKLQQDADLRARIIGGGLETAQQYNWPIIAKSFSVWLNS